jgi:tetratricopeptide (TPR) repeat protein
MKNLILLFSIFCFVLSCKNSDENTAINESCKKLEEALKNVADTASLRETLEKAYGIADKYSVKRHDSLIAVVSKAVGSSSKRNFFQKGLCYGSRQLPITEDIMMRLYRNTGMSYYNSDNYSTALKYFDSVRITSTEKPLLVIKIQNLISIAQCFQYLKDYGSSEHFFQNAIQLSKTCMTEKESVALYMRYASCLRV